MGWLRSDVGFGSSSLGLRWGETSSEVRVKELTDSEESDSLAI
jgi:hypothetical protein